MTFMKGFWENSMENTAEYPRRSLESNVSWLALAETLNELS